MAGSISRFRQIIGTDGIIVTQDSTTINVSGANFTAPFIPVTNVVNNSGAGQAIVLNALSESQTVATLRRITGTAGLTVTTDATGNILIDASNVNVNLPLFVDGSDSGIDWNGIEFSGAGWQTSTFQSGQRSVLRVAMGSVPGSGTVTRVAVRSNNLTISGSPIDTAGTITVDLPTVSGLVAGTYANAAIAVDTTGRVTGIASGTTRTFALSGDVTGSVVSDLSAGFTIGALLPEIFVGGTFTVSTIVVDSKGRIIDASSGTAGSGGGGGGGTVTSVAGAAGPGLTLTGGPITTAGTLTFGLTTTGVAAGTYGRATVEVDAYGRIIGISANPANPTNYLFAAESLGTGAEIPIFAGVRTDGSGFKIAQFNVLAAGTGVALGTSNGIITISAAGAGGTVTSVTAEGGTDVTVSGSPITTAGTLTLGLSTTGVAAGIYTKVEVDTRGRVRSAGQISGADLVGFTIPGAFTVNGTLTASAINATINGVTDQANRLSGPRTFALSGDVTGSATSDLATGVTIAATMPSLIAPGTFALATITVDSKGRVTAASAGSLPASVTLVAASGDTDITVTGSPITGAGTLAFSLSNTGVTVGTYERVSVDAKGRVVQGFGATYVQSLTISSGSGVSVTGSTSGTSGSYTVALAAAGPAVATYNFATVQVDANGRVVAGSSGTPATVIPPGFTSKLSRYMSSIYCRCQRAGTFVASLFQYSRSNGK
jgi:hypothetical protein